MLDRAILADEDRGKVASLYLEPFPRRRYLTGRCRFTAEASGPGLQEVAS